MSNGFVPWTATPGDGPDPDARALHDPAGPSRGVTPVLDEARSRRQAVRRERDHLARARAALMAGRRRYLEVKLKLLKGRMGSVGTWHWDLASGQLTYSPEMLELLGIRPEAVAATWEGFLALVDDVDRERVRGIVEDAIRDPKKHNLRFDFRAARGDGPPRTLEVVGRLERVDGRAVGVLATSQDLTDRRDMEERLQSLNVELERLLRERGAVSAGSERSFHRLIETATEGIWTLDAELRIVWANQPMAEMLGSTPVDLVGRAAADFVFPPLHELAPDRRNKRRDVRLRSVTGYERWAIASMNPILDDSGALTGVLEMFSDVTELKRSERHLGIQYRVGRLLADATGMEDVGERLLRLIGSELGWPIAAMWLVDGTREQLRCASTWHDRGDTADRFLAACRELTFRRGVPLPGRVWASDIPAWISDLQSEDDFARKDAVAAAGLRTGFAFPIRGAAGVIGVFEFFTTDVRPVDEVLLRLMETIGAGIGQFHDRVRAETEGARLLRTARFLSESSETLARSLDYQGTLRRVAELAVPTLADWAVVDVAEEGGMLRRVAVAHPNPERLQMAEDLARRYPEDPSAPNGVAEVFRTGAPQLIPEVTPAMLERGARDPDHLRLLRALDLRSVILAPMTARGRVLGVISLVTAESGRRYGAEDLAVAEELARRAALAVDNARLFRQAQQAEDTLRRYAGSLEDRVVARTAELQASNDQLEAFSYSVSHDLRAPLRGMQGFAQALLEDYGDRLDDTARQYAHRIITAAAHMDALVQDLLAYSRLSRFEFDAVPVSLEAAVEEAREQLRATLEASGAVLEVSIPRDLPRVLGHPATLFQVVANLISNAAKFVPPDTAPHIVVTAVRTGRNVRMWVDDNGIGISPQHHERIFGVFERLHGRDQYPGTGVGLAIVRKAMDRLGGKVGLESRPAGGTRFWIELKAVENDP